MLKKLTKFGNSKALVLDKSILALLGINEDTYVKLEVHGNILTVKPSNLSSKETLKQIYSDTINTLTPEDNHENENLNHDSCLANKDSKLDKTMIINSINNAKMRQSQVAKMSDSNIEQLDQFREYFASEKAQRLHHDIANHQSNAEFVKLIGSNQSSLSAALTIDNAFSESAQHIRSIVMAFWKEKDQDIYHRLLEQQNELKALTNV
ncbi:MAG: hypothetical protein ACON5A_02685 [Candidatus Comchoanobacterales bacterium]